MLVKYVKHLMFVFSLCLATGCFDDNEKFFTKPTEEEKNKGDNDPNNLDNPVYVYVLDDFITSIYKSRWKVSYTEISVEFKQHIGNLSPEIKIELSQSARFNPILILEPSLKSSAKKFGFKLKPVNFQLSSTGDLEVLFEFREFVNLEAIQVTKTIQNFLSPLKTGLKIFTFEKENFSFHNEPVFRSSPNSFLEGFLKHEDIQLFKNQSPSFHFFISKFEKDVSEDIQNGLIENHHDISLILLKKLIQSIEVTKYWDLILALWTETAEKFSGTLAKLVVEAFKVEGKSPKRFESSGKLNPGEFIHFAEERGVSQEVLDVIKTKLNSFDFASPLISHDIGPFRKWFDFIVNLPWQEESISLLSSDPEEIKKEFKKFIYGFNDPINSLTEHLILNEAKDPNRSIGQNGILLIGPAGVGKTHLAGEIARILGRKFISINLGGKSTEGVIRGHDSVYLGSGPGEILKALANLRVKNPVILLDEIDKLTTGGPNGSPMAALLELLDPIQMANFTDNYAEVPFDLTKVLFIATANSYNNIPYELLNRLNVITLDGYSPKEKIEITQNYLLPKLFQFYRLESNTPTFTNKSIEFLIRTYTREAGVRDLEKKLKSLLASWISCQKNDKCLDKNKLFTEDRIKEVFKGKEPIKESFSKKPTVGAVHGLYWSLGGGGILDIQAVKHGKSPDDHEYFKVTGNLGKVMEESTQVALSYVLAHADDWGINIEEVSKSKIHIHATSGSTPKDGPSAGAALTTVIVSLLTNREVDLTYAMTGEINLLGEVTAIGGLKEKIIGAMNEGITHVLYPKQNQKDVDKIKDNNELDLTGVELIPVEHINEVLKRVLIK